MLSGISTNTQELARRRTTSEVWIEVYCEKYQLPGSSSACHHVFLKGNTKRKARNS